MRWLLASILIATAPHVPGAPVTTLRVIVVDSAGTPLPDATVRIAPLGRTARANFEGNSLFDDLPDGRFEVTVAKIGYTPRTVSFTAGPRAIDSLRVVL